VHARRLIVVDDGFLTADLLVARLRNNPSLAVVARHRLDAVPTADEVVRLEPDATVLVTRGDGLATLQALAELVLAECPDIVVVSSDSDERTVVAAARAGARAWADDQTSFEQLLSMLGGEFSFPASTLSAVLQALSSDLRRVRNGANPLQSLSERERQVLHHLMSGMSDTQIGRALSISEHTVRTHVAHILGKLNVHSRVQAVAVARRVSAEYGPVWSSD
jgi:DNA-binding NarL/FixJ family response regulator